MKLRQVIADKALPLGATDPGRTWCQKALHPADSATPVSIPDDQSRPAAFLAFQAQYKVSPIAGLTATDTWDCDVLLTGDMICPGMYVVEKTGVSSEPYIDKTHCGTGLANRFLNPQLTGSGATPEEAYQAKLLTLTTNCREARIAYFSATAEIQAPALSDQGTLSCAQYGIPDDDFCASYHLATNATTRALKKIKMTHFDQLATYSSLQSFPNAFTGKAKDGCYTVMKLAAEDFHFRNMRSTEAVHTDWDAATASYATDMLQINQGTGVTGPIGCCRDLTILKSDGTGVETRDERLPRLTNQVSHLCFRGLAPTTSIYVTIRSGYEITVSPGSIYSPYVRAPVAADRLAMEAYFGISRQLADAYPGEYNSLSALLPVIASIASDVLPTLVPNVMGIVKQLHGAWKKAKSANSGNQNGDTSKVL